MKAEREAAIAAGEEEHHTAAQGLRAWLKDARDAIKANWFLFVYMVFLMTGFNSTSHGSQDLYPTFLKNRKLSPTSLPRISGIQRLNHFFPQRSSSAQRM